MELGTNIMISITIILILRVIANTIVKVVTIVN